MPAEKSIIDHFENQGHFGNRELNKSMDFDENSKVF